LVQREAKKPSQGVEFKEIILKIKEEIERLLNAKFIRI
jgi:hypothetical protein